MVLGASSRRRHAEVAIPGPGQLETVGPRFGSYRLWRVVRPPTHIPVGADSKCMPDGDGVDKYHGGIFSNEFSSAANTLNGILMRFRGYLGSDSQTLGDCAAPIQR